MSNLPPPAFCASLEYLSSTEINAPIEHVWAILTDLESYPLWNPFYRSAVMVDPQTHKPTADRTLAEGVLEVAMQMPPSMDSSKKPGVHYELISLVDGKAHRIIWGGGRVPSLFRAETVHALSTTADGKTLYEARKTYGGASAYVIKMSIGENIRISQEAMVEALKTRAEAV